MSLQRSALTVIAACTALACEPPTFDPPSLVQSVRILATRTDTPYAVPGATVTLTALTVDGRRDRPEPMQISALPSACINPEGDAYYGCFPAFHAAFARGIDLSAILRSGDTFSFAIPHDIVTSHPSAGDDAYGLAVLFTLACAGHVEYVPPLPGGSPDAIPFGCFAASGTRLGAEDFMFAYSLVYAFNDRSNDNPLFDGVTYGGRLIEPSLGLSVPHCEKSKLDDCPATKLDVAVPATSQELDPSNRDERGHVLREELYVQYYASGGKITNDTTVLFDPRGGRLAQTGNDFRAPLLAGEYQLWAVVRDNRGGAMWQTLALHVN